jgi:hypothetical protein
MKHSRRPARWSLLDVGLHYYIAFAFVLRKAYASIQIPAGLEPLAPLQYHFTVLILHRFHHNEQHNKLPARNSDELTDRWCRMRCPHRRKSLGHSYFLLQDRLDRNLRRSGFKQSHLLSILKRHISKPHLSGRQRLYCQLAWKYGCYRFLRSGPVGQINSLDASNEHDGMRSVRNISHQSRFRSSHDIMRKDGRL